MTVPLSNNDYIKGASSFSTHYVYPGVRAWYGTLSTLDVSSMYMIKVAVATTFTLVGSPVALPQTTTANVGWNWVAYPYPTTRAVPFNQQVPTFVRSACTVTSTESCSYRAGDFMKTNDGYAQFYTGYGWFGSASLTTTGFQPGKGYKIKLTSSGSITWPVV